MKTKKTSHSQLSAKGLHKRYGNIQEVIIQNFRAKPATPMASSPEPDLDDLACTVAVAPLIFRPELNIQAPPPLSPRGRERTVAAAIHD